MKVGDQVVCVHPARTGMTKGATYEIREVFREPGMTLVGLNLWPDILWGTWRFRNASIAEERGE